MEVLRVREVAVRLDEHHDAGRLGVRGHLPESLDDARETSSRDSPAGTLSGNMRTYFTPRALREVDEPAAFVELLRARRGVLLVHPRGGAEVRDHEAECGEVLLRLRDARPDSSGTFGRSISPATPRSSIAA